MSLIYGRIRMEGFVASDFGHLNADFLRDMTAWVKSGQVKYEETVLEGFERAPEGLNGLFRGREPRQDAAPYRRLTFTRSQEDPSRAPAVLRSSFAKAFA